MHETFGDLLRRLRMERHMSIGELARQLGVTTVFVSRVELGKAPPLTGDRIVAAARILQADPNAMILAAARYRGNFEIPFLERNKTAQRMATAMLRASPDWTDAEFKKFILEQLERGDDE